ncbi:hypothetical protein AB6878_17055 [Carnobacterium maltaromaticum]|uniref:hypothetical protein n=1 Tax=Carnobacterium maltaromaticum TaxID=2751 RepID=UPI0039BE9879
MRDRYTPGEPPIKIMIKRNLAMTISDFSIKTGIGQSTISMWIKREVQVQNLPMYFISSISDVSNKTSDQVYHELLRLQAEYEISKSAHNKFNEPDSIDLYKNASIEAETIVNDAKGNKNASQLILPASRKIASAYDKKRSDRFMETLIPLYAELKRPMPAWITSIYKEEEQFNEIAQGYIKCFSQFNFN